MNRRLAILTEIISPYRIPLFNALAEEPGIDLHVIFLAETDPHLRRWRVHKEDIRFSHEVLLSWRKRWDKYNVLLNRGVGRALTAASPDAILCGGYSYVASWQAMFWARSHEVPFLLWSESNLQDQRRGYAPVELLKAEFLRRCVGFVVPGQSARTYLRHHKIPENRIVTAPNAVDNALFADMAARIRRNASEYRMQLDLPEHYFLFTGRLVREKGVFDLLCAYGNLNETLRRRLGLVFVGDGASLAQLQKLAAGVSPGVIKFVGFVHQEQLAIYYALAEMLVLPTHTDTWGLVVNEAMACGLPIILSRAAGCAIDLVRPDWNGLLVSPGDINSLTSAMGCLASSADLCTRMGANSFQHISQYSPHTWSRGVAQAFQAVAGARD